jgi:CubicO group peptidase (beta-lactamase class C family)
MSTAISNPLRGARAAKVLASFVLGLSLLAALALAATDAVYPAATWTEIAPEAAGWSAGGLKAADEVARSIGTSAYLVIDKGRVVHEFGPVSRPMNLRSARKSVLRVLYGIAADRNQVDLGKTLAQLAITDQGGLSNAEAQATVRELLEARSGVYHLAAYETDEMKAARPPRGSHAPGTYWYYNNWDFNTLGTIYRQFTARNVFEALQDELARPLHFEDFRLDRDTQWVSDPDSDHPAYVMCLSVRDLGRLGLLMARGGRWEGKQIVSPAWIQESTRSYFDRSPGVGYGYLWWVGQGGWHFQQRFPGPVFSARGYGGQFLLVDPVRDLVIVHEEDSDPLFARQASGRQFGELLAKIMRAAPAAP